MLTKLTPHISDYRDEQTFDWIGQGGYRTVKVFKFDSEMNMDELRNRGVKDIIFRPAYEPQDTDNDPAKLTPLMAVNFIQVRKPSLLSRNLIWEGLNEPGIETIEQARALNAWYVEFADRMHDIGQRVAGPSFSEGNPKPDRLGFLNEMRSAFEKLDYIAIHEYHRCRRYHREIWNALPVKKPMVITEGGYDSGGGFGDGYIAAGLTPEQYMALLKEIDAELMQDDYVRCYCIFQLGDVYSWKMFNINRTMPYLSGYAAASGGGVYLDWNPPPPVPAEPIVELTANTYSIKMGESVTLSWHIENVQAAYLDGVGVVGPAGNKTFQPVARTMYVLRGVLKDGTEKTASVVIDVQVVDNRDAQIAAHAQAILDLLKER